MQLFRAILLAVFCSTYCSAFSLASIFGGGTQVETAEGVPPPSEIVDSHPHKKPIKPHKPILKPIKPIKPLKPIKNKKPVKGIKTNKLQDLKKKKATFFSHLTLPFFSLHKLKQKNIQKIRPTKTEYVEVTKRVTVHPVCYVTIKHKKPCLQQHHSDTVLDETYDEQQRLEITEDMGDIEDLDNEEGWDWNNREAKGINSTNDYEAQDGGQVFEDVESSESGEDGDVARITYTVDVHGQESQERESELVSAEEETNRRGKYIKIIDPSEVHHTTEEVKDDYPLESSEDVEERIKNLAWATKTVLVTRIEKYTDNRVTATVIAKNCAPVTPHVPKCQKKHKSDAAVIRDRPDLDGPLLIESTPVLPDQPPLVNIEAKDIFNESVAEESESPEEDIVADQVFSRTVVTSA